MADPVQTFSTEADESNDPLLGYKATLREIDPDSETPRKEEQNNNADDNSDTGAGGDLSDVGALQRKLETLEQRFNDAQTHIGQLEGENRAFKDMISNRTQQQEEPQAYDPLNDPDFVEKYKSTFGEDEIAAEANLHMIKAMRDSIKEQYETKFQKLQSEQQTQAQFDRIKSAMWQGMNDAVNTYGEGAQALVAEFINSNGTQGVLTNAIRNNPAVVQSADLLSALIGRLVWQSGGQPQYPQQPNQQRVNPASRPTRSQPQSNNEDEVPREKRIAQAIVDAKSPTQALPFMN